MHFVRSLGMPLPNRFRMAADFCLNTDLRRAFEANNIDVERVRSLLNQAERLGIALDQPTLEYALRQTIARLADFLAGAPGNLRLLERLNAAVAVARSLPFEADLWTPQNVYHEILRTRHENVRESLKQGDAGAAAWLELFRSLGENLSFQVD